MAASRKTSRKPAAKRSGSRGNPAKARVSSAPPKPDPVTARDWIGAARLRTLPLAISPILVGTGAAIAVGAGFHWVLALCCLVVAVSLQIAVNFANDYSDGVRGTDDHRVGPTRLTASGRVAPRAVLIAALIFFGIAAVTGLAIVIRTQFWWLAEPVRERWSRKITAYFVTGIIADIVFAVLAFGLGRTVRIFLG